ncbi:MAG: YlxR family protein [Candidatus Eisenbacteria bacterium]
MRKGHVPVRTCIGCHKRGPKQDLLRLVSTKDGLKIGDADGRGFYLCRDVECLVRAGKNNRMKRSLGRPLSDLESAVLMREVSGQNGVDGACDKGVICCRCTGGESIA